MKILLTNDDSYDTPLLAFVLKKLRELGDLTVVVPKKEQSWTGKSISRFRQLSIEKIKICNHQAYCLDGTPADCVNWATYHLCENKPDLVVSGINIGVNTGLGFALSSGTVGACLEANIADIPGVALSQEFSRDIFNHWSHNKSFPDQILDHLQKQTDILLDKIFPMLLNQEKILEDSVTWNINLPFQAPAEYQMVRTCLGHSFYGSCFKQTGDAFHHELDRLSLEDQRKDADSVVVRKGHVSITRIDIRDLGRFESAR